MQLACLFCSPVTSLESVLCSFVCVVGERMKSRGAPRGPFAVPVPPLATAPGDHNTSQTCIHTLQLSHVQTEPFNLLTIYLFIEDVCFFFFTFPLFLYLLLVRVLPHSFTLYRSLSDTALYSFLKENVKTWYKLSQPSVSACM